MNFNIFFKFVNVAKIGSVILGLYNDSFKKLISKNNMLKGTGPHMTSSIARSKIKLDNNVRALSNQCLTIVKFVT